MLNIFRFLTKLSHGDHDDSETTHPTDKLEIDEEGWFVGPGAERIPTARTQKLAYSRPLGVVWHWTATTGVGRRLAKAIAKPPGPDDRSASWGTLILESGEIVQSASCEVGTWHAGGPSAFSFAVAPSKPEGRPAWITPTSGWRYMTDRPMANRRAGEVSANSLFHGIELENVGQVKKVSDLWSPKRGWYKDVERWRGWPYHGRGHHGPGPIVPENQVTTVDGKQYHAFSDNQIASASRIIRAMSDTYGLDRNAFTLTHAAIDPTRKSDPGPLWVKHLEEILDGIF